MNYVETRDYLTSLYTAYANGDIGPSLDAMADDVIFEYVGPADIFPFCGVRHGKAQYLEALTALSVEFDVLSVEVERVLVDDQGYVVILNASFKSKVTGATMNCQLVDVARIKGDKIVEVREYWDVESVTQQLMGQKLTLANK